MSWNLLNKGRTIITLRLANSTGGLGLLINLHGRIGLPILCIFDSACAMKVSDIACVKGGSKPGQRAEQKLGQSALMIVPIHEGASENREAVGRAVF